MEKRKNQAGYRKIAIKGYAFCPVPWNAESKSLIETAMPLDLAVELLGDFCFKSEEKVCCRKVFMDKSIMAKATISRYATTISPIKRI